MMISIKHLVYEIIEIEDWEGLAENIDIGFGQTNYVEQVIRLNKNLKYAQMKQTLIHELTHAFMWAYGYGQISEQIPIEVMCDFVGCYAEDILKIANNYMNQRGIRK